MTDREIMKPILTALDKAIIEADMQAVKHNHYLARAMYLDMVELVSDIKERIKQGLANND